MWDLLRKKQNSYVHRIKGRCHLTISVGFGLFMEFGDRSFGTP